MRVVPAHVAEEWQRARSAPAILVQQPGVHLHDQRHAGLYPAWLLDQPTHSLEVSVDVWLAEHEDCASYAVELWFGGYSGSGGSVPGGSLGGEQVISKSSCAFDNAGLFTFGAGVCVCVCVCVRARKHAHLRVCWCVMRACVRACERACVRACGRA